METLKKICSHLEDCVLGELGKDKSQVDAKELGEVVDAIKDIKMAIYYASITEAMEDAEYGKDYDENGRMYYGGRRRDSRGRYMYTEPMMDDGTENMETEPSMNSSMKAYTHRGKGGTPYTSRYYTDSKMMKHWYEHKDMGDDNQKLQGLEKDLKDLSEELTDMVGEMSNAEKQMLRTKMQNIIQKI